MTGLAGATLYIPNDRHNAFAPRQRIWAGPRRHQHDRMDAADRGGKLLASSGTAGEAADETAPCAGPPGEPITGQTRARLLVKPDANRVGQAFREGIIARPRPFRIVAAANETSGRRVFNGAQQQPLLLLRHPYSAPAFYFRKIR
jgi:hypothetical protein